MLIMILYYLISLFITGMLLWNFIREKKNIDEMLHYLLVLIPLLLRLLRLN